MGGEENGECKGGISPVFVVETAFIYERTRSVSLVNVLSMVPVAIACLLLDHGHWLDFIGAF